MKRLLLALLTLVLATAAHAASPLPADSLYQLQVPLTDQDGHRFSSAQLHS